jgi:hypothetical protein
MRKGLLAVVLGSLVVLGVSAAKTAPKYTCTLANKTVEKCCCITQKDGKLYCTLARKTVDPCCCVETKSR